MNESSDLNINQIQFINGTGLDVLRRESFKLSKGSPIIDISSSSMINKIDGLVARYLPDNEFKLKMRKYLTSENVYLVEVNDSYKFRPDLLSYIFYGNDQLYTLILGANNMKTFLEFIPEEKNNLIYIFKEATVKKILNIQ